jgi:hypothetical protein
MEQKTRLSGRVAARITSRGPALEMQEHSKSLRRNCLPSQVMTCASSARLRPEAALRGRGRECITRFPTEAKCRESDRCI